MRAGDTIWLIGDPHFGRNFATGTPLNRRGDRERMQREQFREELATEAAMIVMVGDLFDKPIIPLPVLSQVINDVIEAALARPHVQFAYLAGNHDLSRQLAEEGAWHIFELAVGWLENVHIINEPTALSGVMLYPWEWGCTAVEQVEKFGSASCKLHVGHWDLKDFGGDTSHMVPASLIREACPDAEIYSGHYHTEGDYEVDGVTVHCTGSLQPYAHGEGDMYVTLSVEEALQATDLRNKCVRVILQPGETLPDIDCLQLTATRAETEEEIEIEVSSVFDMNSILDEALAEVPDYVQTFIKERL